MRIFNKRFFFDILWLIFIAVAYMALDQFYVKVRFFALGGEAFIHHFSPAHLMRAENIPYFLLISEYCLAIFVLFFCLKINTYCGIAIAMGLWFFATIDMAFQTVAGMPAQLLNVQMINTGMGSVVEAVSQYPWEIGQAAIITSILFLPLLWRISQSTYKEKSILYVVIPLTLLYALFATSWVMRGEKAINGFAKGYYYAFASLTLKTNQIVQLFHAEEMLSAEKISDTKINKIIVVMDASINYAQYADLGVQKWPQIVDYGRAYSSANCTATANAIFRSRTWQRDGTHTVALQTVESLFTLAKKSGYTTTYLDNQDVFNQSPVRHYFSDAEVEAMDFYVVGEGELYTRDAYSLTLIPQILEKEKVFVLINKVGAATPYGETLHPHASSGNKNYNYKKSLETNTRDFIDALSKNIDDDTIVFYTSDHGQDLQGNIPQCNVGGSIKNTEYTIPFFVMAKEPKLVAALKSMQPRYTNHMTHLEMAESIRNLMGFSVDGVGSIFKSAIHRQHPFCGLYGAPIALFNTPPSCHMLPTLR